MTTYESRRPDLPDEMRRWIGRCKQCKTPLAVMLPHQAFEIATYMDGSKAYSRIVHRPTLTTRLLAPDACPSCGKRIRLQPVKGTFSESRKCDARCTGATGPNCECQCGGANHGAAHAA